MKNGNEIFTYQNEGDDNNFLHNLQTKQTLMQKLNRDTGVYPQLTDSDVNEPTNCLLLSNLFDPSKINLKDDPNFFADTEDDVFDECEKFGKVEKIFIDKYSPFGYVWVKFSNNNINAARGAYEKLNGRYLLY